MNAALKTNIPGPLPKDLIKQCRVLLLTKKEEIFDRLLNLSIDQKDRDRSGDEMDIAAEKIADDRVSTLQEHLKYQLQEIDYALLRLEQGIYGYCEETEEVIENDRLLAIPWTRLCIEGAEIREELLKKFAR